MAALWTPTPARMAAARITEFMGQLESRGAGPFSGDYFALQQWALDHPELFWRAVWEYCHVTGEGELDPALEHPESFPGARWFVNTRLNFAENLLQRRDQHTALVSLLENGERRELSYADLYRRVAQLAASLRAEGVVAGDRVAGFMPNIEETVVAMLAATSIGAVWSSCLMRDFISSKSTLLRPSKGSSCTSV